MAFQKPEQNNGVEAGWNPSDGTAIVAVFVPASMMLLRRWQQLKEENTSTKYLPLQWVEVSKRCFHNIVKSSLKPQLLGFYSSMTIHGRSQPGLMLFLANPARAASAAIAHPAASNKIRGSHGDAGPRRTQVTPFICAEEDGFSMARCLPLVTGDRFQYADPVADAFRPHSDRARKRFTGYSQAINLSDV